MTVPSTDILESQLSKLSKATINACGDVLNILRAYPQQRPMVDTITPEDTVVVCRKEILPEAIAYYRARYETLPAFYTFSPDASLYEAAPDLTVHDFDELTESHKVHIFTSLTAERPGHSGISYIVRQLANKGILHPSVETDSIAKFCVKFPATPSSEEEFIRMAACYNLLKDEESKNAFMGICKARLCGDVSYAPLAVYPQYFNPHLPIEEGDVICEGGICDGKTSIKFSRKIGETGKLFGFEPVPECYETSIRRTKTHPNIHLECKALWKNSEPLPLNISNPTGGYSTVIHGGETTSTCPAISIDEFFTDVSADKPAPTLIKLDVEGAELPVLEGAMETIRTHKPKLIISIYHTNNGNDLVNIPHYIANLNLGYKLYVGHHSVWFNETILYATT